MSFETSKVMGEIGALFLVISPFAGSINTALGLVGLVLLLVAFNGLADYYGDRGIFKNVGYGIIIFIVGIVITVAIIGIAAAGALTEIGLEMVNFTDPTAWQEIDVNNINLDTLAPYLAAMAAALVIMFVLTVVAAYFIRKSLKTIAQRSGVDMFALSGLILLIGAVLTIILFGFLLLWIAMILLAIAFFRLRPLPPPPVPAAQTTTPIT